MLKYYEVDGDFSSRLALQVEIKSMLFSVIRDYYSKKKKVPVGMDFMKVITEYKKKELSKR